MTAARSGKLLKVVTSNFRELVASIQGKVEKISPMHLRTAIDTPPENRCQIACRMPKRNARPADNPKLYTNTTRLVN